VEIGAGFVRMTPPRSPFVTVPWLFLAAPDSDLLTYLEEVHRLVAAAPTLLSLVDADLDAHGKAKKAMRLDDAEWLRRQTATLRCVEETATPSDPEKLALAQGRPRTPAYIVLFALMLRGCAFRPS